VNLDDTAFERQLGALLRFGVLTSALVILVGGAVYLDGHHAEKTDYGTFHDDRLQHLRSPRSIIESALTGSGRGIIQLGLLLLIATPVARVVVSAVGFGRQRDFIYVALTLFVLAVLLYGLFLERP
jgi:uncharacterized membrane protein